MSRTLAEDIDRGRRAIDLARQQGLDTTQWEMSLADLERQEPLAWASELAERDLILSEAIRFEEEPLRPVSITEVSKYAVRHLLAYMDNRLVDGTGTRRSRLLSSTQDSLGDSGNRESTCWQIAT
jgi:hypothetical protein